MLEIAFEFRVNLIGFCFFWANLLVIIDLFVS